MNALRLSRRFRTKYMMLTIIPVFWAAALVLAADPQPSAKAKGVAPQKQASSAEEDKVIEAAIRSKLAKSKIGKDGFTVRVQGGVAYWEGATDVVQHKGSATRMARTAGARRVVNNIKISDSGKDQTANNLNQGRRRVQVKRGERPNPPN